MRTQNTKDRALKGLLWIGSGVGAQVLIQITVLMILARILTPQEYGVVTASVIISGLGLIFTEIGVGPAIVQKKIITNSHISAGFLLSIILAGLMASFINYYKIEISKIFNIAELSNVIPYLSILFLLHGFSVVSESLLQRELKFKKIAIIGFASYLVGYSFVGISLAYYGYSYWALIYAQIAQTVIKTFLFVLVRNITIFPVFSIAPYRELLRFGLGFTVARVANYMANQADKFILSRFLGDGILGLYGRSYQLAIMPINLIGKILDMVTFPVLSELQDDMSKIKSSYEKLLVSASFLSLPISCLLFILSDEIIFFVLGEKWAGVVVIFQVMVIGLLFRLTYRISDSTLKALGRVNKRAIRQIFYALFVLLFSYVGSNYGAKGVAVGVLLAVFINTIMMIQLCVEVTKNSWLEIFKFIFYGYRFAFMVSMPVFFIDILLTHFSMPALIELSILFPVWFISVILIVRYIPEIFFRELGLDILRSISTIFPLRLKKLILGGKIWREV